MIENADRAWLKALIAFLYLFGVRITEALMLRRGDFSISGGKLVVRLRLLKKRKKSGPFADFHILRVSLEAPFIQHILYYLRGMEPDQRVWPLAENKNYARWKAWNEIKRLNRKCTPHIFRHSRLTKLALKGADAPVLMDWAGWSDPRPAGRYLHMSGSLAEKFADKVD
ncbi:MAG: tyrosine-type recombinase/integrase [Armatimonadetes bacterium]|nr:tyrosine-type recombinase/integrase [Armatimonadota bacterium]